jgi:amidase
MTLTDIHYQPLTTVAKHIASGDVSPVEVTKAILKRIESLDSGFKSFTMVTPELALAQAKKAETEIAKGVYRARCTAFRSRSRIYASPKASRRPVA